MTGEQKLPQPPNLHNFRRRNQGPAEVTFSSGSGDKSLTSGQRAAARAPQCDARGRAPPCGNGGSHASAQVVRCRRATSQGSQRGT
eukprot:5765741-Prymnesium_polylepis.1